VKTYFGLAGTTIGLSEEAIAGNKKELKFLLQNLRQQFYTDGCLLRTDDYLGIEHIIDIIKKPTDKRTSENKVSLKKLITKLNFFNRKEFMSIDLDEVTNQLQYYCYESGETIFRQGDKPDGYYIVLKGSVQVQIPSPFSDNLILPEEIKAESPKKEKPKIGNLKSLILGGGDKLTVTEMQELTPMEIKKYKTRSMLNEILSSKNVVRTSLSPWEQIKKQSIVKDYVKLNKTSKFGTTPAIQEESKDGSISLEKSDRKVVRQESLKKTTFITKHNEPTEFSDKEVSEDSEPDLPIEKDLYKLRTNGKKQDPIAMTEKGFIDIARIFEGGSFGENSLVDGKPRFCTTKCMQRTHIIYISKTNFEKAVEQTKRKHNSELVNFIKKIPLFESTTRTSLTKLTQKLFFQTCTRG
jgi:CRP-like cAMP-binding protein